MTLRILFATLCAVSLSQGCFIQDGHYAEPDALDMTALGADLTKLDLSSDLEDVSSDILIMPDMAPLDSSAMLDMPDLSDMSDMSDMALDMESTDDMAPIDLGVDMADMAPMCVPLNGTCTTAAQHTEHQIVPIEHCQFGMRLVQDVSLFQDVTTRLASVAGPPVGVDDLVLNRTATPQLSDLNAARMSNHDVFGFSWAQGDGTTESWYPQGITGTDDAYEDVTGQTRRLIVSWYDSDNNLKRGVRLSFVNLDTDPISYRHVLLATPTRRDGEVTLDYARTDPKTPGGSVSSLHAGGIVWFGHFLYVADTHAGLRVFDLNHIYEVTVTSRDDLSLTEEELSASRYRYVIPERMRYVFDAASCMPKFSFIGLDRGVTPPMMTSGEYVYDDTSGRLVQWAMDPQTGLMQHDNSLVRGTAAFVGAQTRMQGALSLQGQVVISSSSQTASKYGRVYRAELGQKSVITAWPYGAEDLYYERSTSRLWTPAEHPGTRDTLSIPFPPP